MKAAVYYGQQDIRIEEKAIPEIDDDEALVQMKACGVCGSDLMDWYLRPRAPLVLGHEPAGKLAKKGGKVKEFEVGDRVFVHHHVACLTCHHCQRGNYTLCDQFHNTNIKPGGFAEYFLVPVSNLQKDTLKIPDDMSFEEATLIEPVGCCLRALGKAGIHAGDSVAIVGAGTTGIIHTILSKTLGASQIIVSDPVEYRLTAARMFGADICVDPEKESLKSVILAETDGRGVDLAIVTAPSIEAYRTALEVCCKGGKLLVFAPTLPGKHLEISPKELFFSEIQVVSSYSTSHLETRQALELIRSGRVNASELITHRYRLEETAEAFRTASESKESLKVVILSGD